MYRVPRKRTLTVHIKSRISYNVKTAPSTNVSESVMKKKSNKKTVENIILTNNKCLCSGGKQIPLV